MSNKTQFWLMKTEPTTYSIDNLEKDGSTHWEGIRNYQARNFMTHSMNVGDKVLIYHSNSKPPGIVGLASIDSEPYPDHFAWDKKSDYFDKKSTKSAPRWYMVDVAFETKFNTMIPLDELKSYPELLDMMVVKKGMRLSIQPVKQEHYTFITSLAEY